MRTALSCYLCCHRFCHPRLGEHANQRRGYGGEASNRNSEEKEINGGQPLDRQALVVEFYQPEGD